MSKTDNHSSGARIAHAREQRRLTQAELAQRMGVHYMTISKWERGDQVPKRPGFLALGEVLGVSASWLETGVGSGIAEHLSSDTPLLASAILLVDRMTQVMQNPVPLEKRAILIARVFTLCKEQGLQNAAELPVDDLWRVG